MIRLLPSQGHLDTLCLVLGAPHMSLHHSRWCRASPLATGSGSHLASAHAGGTWPGGCTPQRTLCSQSPWHRAPSTCFSPGAGGTWGYTGSLGEVSGGGHSCWPQPGRAEPSTRAHESTQAERSLGGDRSSWLLGRVRSSWQVADIERGWSKWDRKRRWRPSKGELGSGVFCRRFMGRSPSVPSWAAWAESGRGHAA